MAGPSPCQSSVICFCWLWRSCYIASYTPRSKRLDLGAGGEAGPCCG